MSKNLTNRDYKTLISRIGILLQNARAKAVQQVNTVLVATYWEIGKYIVEYEQGGKEKAEYGSDLLNRLSKDLTLAYGKGFSRSNVFQIRKLYIVFPKIQTLSGFLSWSHYSEILKSDDVQKI